MDWLVPRSRESCSGEFMARTKRHRPEERRAWAAQGVPCQKLDEPRVAARRLYAALRELESMGRWARLESWCSCPRPSLGGSRFETV